MQITQAEIDQQLDGLGLIRVRQVVKLCPREPWGWPDLILAIASRESDILNITEGQVAAGNGKGAWQIDKRSWSNWLSLVPGVAMGTWGPVLHGKTALDDGCCPTLADGCKQAVAILKDYWNQVAAWAPSTQHARAMISSYNAGPGGARSGWDEHRDTDYFTTGSDYAADVFARQSLVHHYLRAHHLVP